MRAGSPWNATLVGASSSHRCKSSSLGEERPQLAIDLCDVGWIAGESDPAEGTDAATEERPDIGRDEARVCECLIQAGSIRLTPQVVSIIENVTPHPDEIGHRPDVCHDRLGREPEVLLRIPLAKRRCLLEGNLGGDVTGERVVSRGLVGDEVEHLAARDELRQDVRRIPPQADGERLPRRSGRTHPGERVVERRSLLVEVPGREPTVDRALVDLDAQDGSARHRRSERLGAAHSPEAGRQDGPPGQVGRAEVLLARGAERLVRPLQDPLGADVDPGARGHLPEHRQALRLEPAKLVPCRPRRNEERVRDEDARRVGMCPEHADGLPRLDEESLVLAEANERAHDVPERLVRPRGAPGAAVDDERLRVLGDVWIEVVQKHA